MSERAARSRVGGQDGYTAVEMVITMALTAIMSGAIFSSFLVLDRIQSAWEQRDQARAVGVLAESSLVRDVQEAYKVPTQGSTLVLQGVSTKDSTGVQTAPLLVTYFTQGAQLMRKVQLGSNPPSIATIVAHGVRSIDAECKGNTLTIGMTLDAISIRFNPEQVKVSPLLTLTPRHGTCP